MTDKLSSLPTQSVTPSQTAVLSPKSAPAWPHHVSHKVQAPIEEEPYTIKCICGFADDDGNTIYCETCDTWQHIECYYPNTIDEALREDFAHSCTDCKPRSVDHQGALERQRLRRSKPNTLEASERKVKRPPTKNNKKKTKPTDLIPNGHTTSDSNPKHTHDYTSTHQHKKSKSTHRANQSISSQNPKRSPSYGQKSGNPHGHPPSPATTPPDVPREFEMQYSNAFLNLYKDDRDVSIVQTNSFATLSISNVLSLWLRDHDKLRADTRCAFDDVFQSLPSNIDSTKASPRVESKKVAVGPDTFVHSQHLTTSEVIDKDVPLIELNGQIGIQKDYCEDPENRWQELITPLPFVFFHPMLPIYIDTRKEGSLARYVRRSCKPNAVLDTYLSDSSEYHFWLVSDRRIVPSEQITIPWEFKFNLQKDVARRWAQLLGLGDDEAGAPPPYNEEETDTYQNISSWVHAILTEYGGCACDLAEGCAFTRFHRNYILKPQQQSKGSKGTKKKPRKTKTNAISPTSTGHATNSRAPSEGRGDDGMDNDSGSSRSKPPSRDMTPAPRQGSFDQSGVLTELTDRDKRKVQMVEDTFRRMEQQQPPRKKKRTSDGTNSSTTTAKPKPRGSSIHSTGVPNGASERRYVDAGTSRSMSGSPSSAISPNTAGHFKHEPRNGSNEDLSRRSSQGPRPEYCDVSVQTDPVDGEWFSSLRQAPKPKRRVVSLSKRLLESRHRLRADEDRRRVVHAASPTSVMSALVKMDLESPTAENSPGPAVPEVSKQDKPSPTPLDSTADTPMTDAPSISPTDTKPSLVEVPITAAPIKHKSPELRVQMPPVPAFNNSASPSVTTPMSANGTLTQSPFSASSMASPFAQTSVNGVAVQPSPVKKKLSLSDYTKSRMNKAAAAKPVGPSLKPPATVMEEAKSPTSTDTAMLDPPVTEKSID